MPRIVNDPERQRPRRVQCAGRLRDRDMAEVRTVPEHDSGAGRSPGTRSSNICADYWKDTEIRQTCDHAPGGWGTGAARFQVSRPAWWGLREVQESEAVARGDPGRRAGPGHRPGEPCRRGSRHRVHACPARRATTALAATLHRLRDSAPLFPATRPDLDKLARSTLDGLNGRRDLRRRRPGDRTECREAIRRHTGSPPGAVITIREDMQ